MCLAPEVEKARARALRKAKVRAKPVDEVDPDTFLFEDDEEEEYEPAKINAGSLDDLEEDEYGMTGFDEDEW